jgi:hypothetical protein
MALDAQGRGWRPKDTPLELINRTEILKFRTTDFDDGDMVALQGATGLKEIYFIDTDFPGETPQLSDIPAVANADTIQVVSFNGCTSIDLTFPAAWSACTELQTIEAIDCGLTQAQVDAFLVALNTARVAGLGTNAVDPEVTLTGNAGAGTASAAARSALTGAGWTVSKAT